MTKRFVKTINIVYILLRKYIILPPRSIEVGLPAQANIEVIDDASRAEIALHPIRRQLLAELELPESASSLARKLGLARQKVN